LRVVLTTIGSLGDLHPYVAVGRELRSRGHGVTLATSEVYRDKVEALGLGFHPIRPDLGWVQADPEVMRRAMDKNHGGETVIVDLVMPYVRHTYADLLAACRGADVLVGHMLAFAARLVSETTGIPWASAVLQPVCFFSAIDPPVLPAMPGLERLRWLGPGFHRALFRVGRRMTRGWATPWHVLRAELGLPPTDENPVFEGQHSPRLVLALFSSALAPRQADWPAATVVTGFPFFDSDGTAGPDPALARFLDAGPAPIVFTLGSSAVADPGAFYSEGAEAARRLGRRALLLVGRDGPGRPASLPGDVAAFDYAPYSAVFPRAAAVVHQGGVGTTAQAMRAGKPMLVMPYSHDQFDNGARMRRAGAGLVVARDRFDARRAAGLLSKLLDDPTYAARAKEIATSMAGEDGARAAADAVERLGASAPGLSSRSRPAVSFP
jgi:UDP:flavonoid glycosyltransferase YjiC (YdhE family)